MSDGWHTEITVFEKHDGVLSKRIWLDEAGNICSDGSACVMPRGSARRVVIPDIGTYANLINTCTSNQALALGRLKDGLPAEVKVITAEKLNGGAGPATIARTKDYLTWDPGTGGLAPIDFDPKGMSAAVKQKIDECGGVFGALCEVLPALETVALVERSSTSSGLRDSKTGKAFVHSGGKHFVIAVVDAADIPRFLSALNERCWLHGFGWGMVSAAGSFLKRSIVDKACGAPERLFFEGAPVVTLPLVQDARTAIAHEGAILDTRLCELLSDDERAQLARLVDLEEHRLLPARQAARSTWSLKHIEHLIARGVPEREARAQVDRWIDSHELTGAFELPFDRKDLAGAAVADVLADPDRFIDQTMADPHEGAAYGRGKAILYRRIDGSLFVHSFAHGGMIYELKPDPSTGLAVWDAGDDIELPPPRAWLLGNVFCRTFLSMLIAEGGTGKTAVRYAQYLSLATGRPLTGEHVFQRCRVLVVSLEDNDKELRRRILAARLHHDVSLDDVRGWLFLAAPGNRAGKLLTLDAKNKPLLGHLAAELEAEIITRRIDVVALDPFIKAHGVGESDNNLIDQVAQILTDLATKHDIAVDVPHHARKGASEPGDADRGRGASAAKDAARLVYTLTQMSSDEAEKFSIPEEDRRTFVRMDSAKVNPVKGTIARWFRLVGVRLGNESETYPNGDEVQTVETWSPPEAWAGLDNGQLNRILDAIDAGVMDENGHPTGERYSNASAATTRAAWQVVQESAPGKTEDQCRTIIRQWVLNGVLVAEQYRSEADRKDRTGLRVIAAKRPGTEVRE